MSGGQIMVMVSVMTVCGTVILLRMLRLKYRDRDRQESPDVGTMQEMNRGLQRMEERIEALETLLMDVQKRRQAKSEFE